MRRPTMIVLMALMPSLSFAQIVGEVQFVGCNETQRAKIVAAMADLLPKMTVGGPLEECLADAVMDRDRNASPEFILDALRLDTVTHIECTTLEFALGRAPDCTHPANACLDEETLLINNDLATNGEPDEIAATIAHEVSHNRGWLHSPEGVQDREKPLSVPYTVEINRFVRTTKDAASVARVVTSPIVVSTEEPPSISISGPSSGIVDTDYFFSASASNCTPIPDSWSWTTSSGTISGSANAATVGISWSTTGSKTIDATNPGCSGVSGQRTVSITDAPPPPPDGGLEADFTFNPSDPLRGETVTFTSASSGSPTYWSWDFGDGGTGLGTPVQHVFVNPGSFPVELSIGRLDPGCTFGICEDSIAKTVVVSGEGILLSGPSSGLVNQELVYTAQAFGCVAEPEGWNWNVDAVTIVGGPMLNLSFPDIGERALSVSSSSCGSFIDSVTVTIVLTPEVSISGPESGVVGQPLLFTVSALGCGGDSNWTWNLDGIQIETGSSVRTSFATPGVKQIEASDASCPDSAATTVTILSANVFDDGFETGDVTAWSDATG